MGVSLGGDRLGGNEARGGGTGGSEVGRAHLRRLDRGADGYDDDSAAHAVTTQGDEGGSQDVSLGGDSSAFRDEVHLRPAPADAGPLRSALVGTGPVRGWPPWLPTLS